MANEWIEKVTGAFEDKRRYKQDKTRIAALPSPYREAAEALERYAMRTSGIAQGDVLLKMLEDLVDLFERHAADGTPLRSIVGEDPVEFAEDFLSNYKDADWTAKEKRRLAETIASLERGESS